MYMNNKLKDYYNGRLSPKEERNVEIWLASGNADAESDSLMKSLFDAEIEKCKQSKKVKHNRQLLINASCCTLIVAISIILTLFFTGPQETILADVEWNELRVPLGTQQRVVLSDSSVLTLSPGTRMTYPSKFSGKERKVFIDGEVFAHITSDSEHPFIISSKDNNLKVYGTTFNYNSFDENQCVEVYLLDGSVAIELGNGTDKQSISLSPGHMVQYNRANHIAQVHQFDSQSYNLMNGHEGFRFMDVPLSDICNKLSQHFNKKLIISDPSIRSRKILAFFTNNESLDEILSSLNTDGKLIIQKKGDEYYISGR